MSLDFVCFVVAVWLSAVHCALLCEILNFAIKKLKMALIKKLKMENHIKNGEPARVKKLGEQGMVP